MNLGFKRIEFSLRNNRRSGRTADRHVGDVFLRHTQLKINELIVMRTSFAFSSFFFIYLPLLQPVGVGRTQLSIYQILAGNHENAWRRIEVCKRWKTRKEILWVNFLYLYK